MQTTHNNALTLFADDSSLAVSVKNQVVDDFTPSFLKWENSNNLIANLKNQTFI